MEPIFYELKPYLLIIAGLFGLRMGALENLSEVSIHSIGPISGVIMLACAAIIIFSRYLSRQQSR